MSQPTVACIMLVSGRPEMVKRAARAFQEQTYERKRLLIWDTGTEDLGPLDSYANVQMPIVNGLAFGSKPTIGELRNAANKYAMAHYTTRDDFAEILIHWDSDDWSHPRRVAEQVAHLEESGKDCVGYNELVFMRSTGWVVPEDGQKYERHAAWLYRNARQDYAVGTSLCYWSHAWASRYFEHLPERPGGTGEDTAFLRTLRCEGTSGLHGRTSTGTIEGDLEPRLIATIHGGNTQYYGSDLMEHSPSWKRAPEWDFASRYLVAG